MAATAPVRIVGSAVSATCNGTAPVDQFNALYVATFRDSETAILVTPRTKTHSALAIQMDPGTYYLKETVILHACFSHLTEFIGIRFT